MTIDERADEIEKQAFAHLKKNEWQDARRLFHQMLDLDLGDKRRAITLQNVMLTWDKEGNTKETIDAGIRALAFLEKSPYGKTNEGVYAHGMIKGMVGKKEGRNFPLGDLFPILAAYASGAAIGAALGRRIVVHSVNLHGPVVTDLRYGSAVMGALAGWILFSKLFVRLGPFLSAMATVVAATAMWRILLELDTRKGGLILLLLGVLPIVGSLTLLAKFKAKS